MLNKRNIPAKTTPLPKVRSTVRETVEVASRLKSQRKRKGLSRAKLAELSGVSLNMIYVIETNRSVPTIDILLKLCKALKIGPGTLFPGGK